MRLLPKLTEVKNVATGLAPDLHPQMNFVWRLGSNVRFTATGVKKMPGWVTEYTRSSGESDSTFPRGMGALVQGGTEELHFGNDTKLFYWDGSTITTDALTFTGNKHLWSFAPWGNWMLATNGKDAPVIYKGSSYATLGGSPPSTAEIFVVDHAHVIAFNTDAAENGFEWCHADDVEQWTPSDTNAAGDLIIREFGTEIVAAVPLGEVIAVYSGNALALVRYVGTPFYYAYDVTITEGVSVFNKKSVVSAGLNNYGLGSLGFFVTNGSEVTELGDDAIKDYFFDDLNSNATNVINAYHNTDTKEIVWYYPSGSSTEPDKAIAYNYVTNTFSFHDQGRYASLPAKTSGQSSIFRGPLTIAPPQDSSQAYRIVRHNSGVDNDSEPMVCWVESKPFAFMDADGRSMEDLIKYVEAIKLYFGEYDSDLIKIKVGLKEDLDDETYYHTLVVEGEPSSPNYIDVAGRWIILRVESEELSSSWELQGFVIHGTVIGGPA